MFRFSGQAGLSTFGLKNFYPEFLPHQIIISNLVPANNPFGAGVGAAGLLQYLPYCFYVPAAEARVEAGAETKSAACAAFGRGG
jgi:hypothetical protein